MKTLHEFFSYNKRIAVAYSGGVDSSYLLYAAKAAGCDARAYFVKTQFQPKRELDGAARFAETIGAALTVAALDALNDGHIAENPPNRCYYCKTAIIAAIRKLAGTDGIGILCDGTNADDDETDRPGMMALREQGVISPLRDSGLTKADIRRLSRQEGLFTHDKPSYSCLATRVPTGTAITEGLLGKIECAEDALSAFGFSDFRVRVRARVKQAGASGALRFDAVIQMPSAQWDAAAMRRAEILTALQPEFGDVMLDLRQR